MAADGRVYLEHSCTKQQFQKSLSNRRALRWKERGKSSPFYRDRLASVGATDRTGEKEQHYRGATRNEGRTKRKITESGLDNRRVLPLERLGYLRLVSATSPARPRREDVPVGKLDKRQATHDGIGSK
ncbi:uncharacterized protein LOC122535706 isoform X2 [Frieseomelitta varia]|uniref:uncharacterized protein LOC122535706 isoform X2 n=1 Tax=Frieseomelitta varia TaxID=561572 RepID=UPI001CB6868C|nr:uncharacterized protein LOC122535706 isoform X2 [Frieseomelitta varia]